MPKGASVFIVCKFVDWHRNRPPWVTREAVPALFAAPLTSIDSVFPHIGGRFH